MLTSKIGRCTNLNEKLEKVSGRLKDARTSLATRENECVDLWAKNQVLRGDLARSEGLCAENSALKGDPRAGQEVSMRRVDDEKHKKQVESLCTRLENAVEGSVATEEFVEVCNLVANRAIDSVVLVNAADLPVKDLPIPMDVVDGKELKNALV
ncbi:uncharacterized protein G2W53_037175 [Senna tora]|uniref:Uncharacterized protein n=1 Tax=Senna tora TaxID=362788 RepID=A0A834SVF8_9FABA|nr:uncharacterized protein G2W53_037175 [Senna tora]